MKIMAIDSNSILNRAFYGIKLLTTRDGTFTNAVYGFFNITLKLLDDYQPDMALFAFDLKAPTFRHQMYEGYKANRKGMPPELAQQLIRQPGVVSVYHNINTNLKKHCYQNNHNTKIKSY